MGANRSPLFVILIVSVKVLAGHGAYALIPALQKLEQTDLHALEASLFYIGSSRTAKQIKTKPVSILTSRKSLTAQLIGFF